MGDSVEIKLILFENQIQTTSTSPCRTQVQPAASFLVCSLIFIEYKELGNRLFFVLRSWVCELKSSSTNYRIFSEYLGSDGGSVESAFVL